MATALLMRWDGVTQEQYDAVMDHLNLDEDRPDGGIFHISGFTGDGLRVVDVWDSQDHFERFMEARLQSAVQEAGIEGEPQLEYVELYNVWAPRGEELVQQGAKAPAA